MIRMVQPLTADMTLDGTIMDVGSLLKLMDITTCASAEKHTGVNCVTLAMGDVALERMPTVGAIVELIAEPVLVGNTSLDIALHVKAEIGTEQYSVCQAFFTYVTTRHPETGAKQLCPPLTEEQQSERQRWETTLARYRKAMVEREKAAAKRTGGAQAPGTETQCDVELTEVVLPAHQNHMGHTFGGVTMANMHKAALVAASRHALVGIGQLRTLGVHRVEFPQV